MITRFEFLNILVPSFSFLLPKVTLARRNTWRDTQKLNHKIIMLHTHYERAMFNSLGVKGLS